jgi:hypothetical protein
VDKYTIYEGKFPCKECKKEVKTIRVYAKTGMASWMCPEKHLSEVELFKVGYKKKRVDERKVGE